jgi:hypothetical protein
MKQHSALLADMTGQVLERAVFPPTAKPKPAIPNAYRDELKKSADRLPWNVFATVAKGFCPPDEVVKRKLYLIEAMLNRQFVSKNYHKLVDGERFSGLAGFEGVRANGTRHAHFVFYVPQPKRGNLSREEIIERLPYWINILWHDPLQKPWSWSIRRLRHHSGWFDWLPNHPIFYRNELGEWCERKKKKTIPLQIGLCRLGGGSYCVKDVLRDKDYLSWWFVTPPKYKNLRNENRNVLLNKDKQRRSLLGDELSENDRQVSL